MKNNLIKVRERLLSKYLSKDPSQNLHRSTDINVLLNRVKNNQKNEKMKKLYFSFFVSSGLLLFALVIFN